MPSDTMSAGVAALADAISRAPTQVRFARCGFDLWLEVMTSGHVRTMQFRAGGRPASPEETEDPAVLTVPVMVIGRGIVVAFDPTLPPESFALSG